MSNTPVPTGKHILPPLPYAYNALEPAIGAWTLRLHHDKHHKSYVDGLNKAELKLAEARQKRDFSLVKHWERELAFHGSGHILHCIYWDSMCPVQTRWQTPGAQTMNQITRYFGSLGVFTEQFSEAAINVEGSGWAVLIWQPAWERLEILAIEKHQDCVQIGGIPILALDVWEHAYYLDYQNKRKDYVVNWWQIVNWEGTERRLELAMQAKMPLTL